MTREERTRTMKDAMSTTPNKSSSPPRRIGLLGSLAAAACLALGAFGTATASADFGISNFTVTTSEQDGSPAFHAGEHPFSATTAIDFNTTPDGLPDGFVKDLLVNLPPGLIGDPNATPQCTREQLEDGSSGQCPADTQIGMVTLKLGGLGSLTFPVWNMQAPAGVPAEFGFRALIPPVFLDASVRTGGDYGLTINLRDVSHALPLAGNSLTLWGVPADPAHDSDRGGPSDAPLKPFLSLPTACNGPLTTTADADSWQNPGVFVHASNTTPIGPQGCDKLTFNPSISVTPGTASSDSPSAFGIDLHVPQNNDPEGLATPQLRKAVVTLPPGVSVNPSAADGLAGCTPAQIGLNNASEPSCPDASKIGTAEIDSPLLSSPLTGGIFLATPNDNPFSSLLAVYVVAEGDGVLVKLPGRIDADPSTGQLTTTFDNNPQVPFTDFKLDFFGGSRAALATPQTCGSFTATTDLMPWSAPGSGPDATPSSTFAISAGPDGNSFSCASSPSARPFSPAFTAGMVSAKAKTFTPFVLTARRADGQQGLTKIDAQLPPGVTAKLAGVPLCPNAAANAGTCDASSQVGDVVIGAGAGPLPFNLQGKVYLTGPYEGAPLGLSIVVPGIAGPFNLGTVVTRAAVNVDTTDAHLDISSDPLPQIVQGIPLRLRSVSIRINRDGFMLSPTNCSPLSVTGQIGASDGPPSQVSQFFQVTGCKSLPFKPNVKGKILGGKKVTGHSKHPGLKVTLKPRAKDANISKLDVTLPHSLILNATNIKICTPSQFNNGKCPKKSNFGRAKATSVLLDKPVKGPAYLVSNKHHKLPDLVLDLKGEIQLIERGVVTGSGSGKLRTSFKTVPDVPISTFSLKIKKGKSGLLVNSRNLCKKKNVAKVASKSYNGKSVSFKRKLKTPCKK